MNSYDQLAAQENFKDFSKAYISYLKALLDALEVDVLAACMEALNLAQQKGNTIFIAGNGGSAATASHMSTDFGSAIFKGGKTGALPYRVQSLTDNMPMFTAAANDFGYQEAFVRQLTVHYREGDLLIVISASGNSQNLVDAARWVKSHGGPVLGFLGFDGGKLQQLCDLSLTVKTPQGAYGPVEDVHMVLDHLLTLWMQSSFARAP